MTREEQIKAIYEKIADKTLSFGCKLQEFYEGKNYTHIIISLINKNEKYYYIRYKDGSGNFNKLTTKIIGHPVMIGDVLDYAEENIKTIFLPDILDNWGNMRKPLEEQSYDCIEYIYNLIK